MFDLSRLDSFQDRLQRQQLSLPLRVDLWNGQRYDFSAGPPRVAIRVPGPGALRCLLRPTLYNLGKAYVEGVIDVQGRAADMIHIVHALARGTQGQASRVRRFAQRWRPHTRARDRAAIAYHYDVSNAFYREWLDPELVYSCAYFEHGDETLATAQRKKIDHILTKIGLGPGQRLLDIGCGWGALVLRAATHFGARCVGITLSANQAELARARVRAAGLEDRIEIRLQDYRDVSGQFERITSVGMFEHVGRAQLPAYFAQIARLLAPDGLAMNHGITTTDTGGGESPFGGGRFIDEYVFPHGELVHLSTVIATMQEGGLEVRDVENLRRHYARTCATWADNFEQRAGRIRALCDARTFRIWQVYLAGCAYAFTHDWISLYQIVCGKAGADPASHAWSRRYMYA